MASLIGTIVGILVIAFIALAPFFLFLFAGERLLARIPLGLAGKFTAMMLKSLRRNLLRTSLTYLAIFVLVVVVTAVWSVLHYLDDLMTEKNRDIKVIVTEKWSASGALPFTYAHRLSMGGADPNRPDDARPLDNMSWQFYIGTLDAAKKTRESFVFLIALEPPKLLTVMDELLDEISTAQRQHGVEAEQRRQLQSGVDEMLRIKQGIIIGRKRLEAINKQVGDRFTLTCLNYKDLNLEFEIVGVLPASGRYDESAFMNRDYLNDALAAYQRKHGAPHAQADKSLNLMWLKVANQYDYSRIANQIETSGYFANPAVKCETLSSAVNTVMESYRDLVWGMRWLLSPAILVTMTLVVSNAISLSVRERRTELAVMKVLGFQPAQILGLVLGEAAVIGMVSGFFSTSMAYVMVSVVVRAYNPMPMAVPLDALWWGPLIGGLTAIGGSILPAWTACRVRVSEVFARVT